MSDIKISGSGDLTPFSRIERSQVTEMFNTLAEKHGQMPDEANLAQADHIAPAAQIAVDRAFLNHLQGG